MQHHMIPTQEIDLGATPKNAKLNRLRVKNIEVIAPLKGTILFDGYLKQTSYYNGTPIKSRKHRANYALNEDFEKIIRKFLNHIFIIDPKSNNIVKVSTKLSIEGGYDVTTWICVEWITTTTVELDISVTFPDKPTINGHHSHNITKTD